MKHEGMCNLIATGGWHCYYPATRNGIHYIINVFSPFSGALVSAYYMKFEDRLSHHAKFPVRKILVSWILRSSWVRDCG